MKWKFIDSSNDSESDYNEFVLISFIDEFNIHRNQNNQGIEELLGLNVRADRIVVNGVDAKSTEKKSNTIAVEWSAYVL